MTTQQQGTARDGLAASEVGVAGRRAAAGRLRSARGHLDAVIRMLDEDRYCVDILHQLTAVEAALAKARRGLLESHARGCVVDAMGAGPVPAAVEEILAAALGGRPPTPRDARRPIP
jgi:DNA-binding FrmR family transcriptional regulator